MNDSPETTALSPEAAFSLLGNETRVAMVQALGGTPEESLSFSALRDRAAVADSGQFNYHLKKLVGSFLGGTAADAWGASVVVAATGVGFLFVAGYWLSIPTLRRLQPSRSSTPRRSAVDLRPV